VARSIQQAGAGGCIQHTFYALTGENEILAHQDEGSPQRFLLRAQDAGYLLWPLYCDRFAEAGPSFWNALKKDCQDETDVRLMVTIKPTIREHVFGVQANFKNGDMIVTDPGMQALLRFTFDQFLQHPDYPRALEVLCVDSGVIDDYNPLPP